jgi:hypothetical protein
MPGIDAEIAESLRRPAVLERPAAVAADVDGGPNVERSDERAA